MMRIYAVQLSPLRYDGCCACTSVAVATGAIGTVGRVLSEDCCTHLQSA